MILIGELSLWVALLMATWSATVSFAGGRMGRADLAASGERATYATFAFVVLSSIGLWSALLSSDFSLRYVASYTSANLPAVYKFAAFWGGQQGSMLFWCLILAGYGALAVFTNRTRNRELMPFVSGTLAAALVFFLATTAYCGPNGSVTVRCHRIESCHTRIVNVGHARAAVAESYPSAMADVLGRQSGSRASLAHASIVLDQGHGRDAGLLLECQ